MGDVIERFRFRFQLWHRERREDLFGMPGTDPRSLREYAVERSPDKSNDPTYRAVMIESTPRFVNRCSQPLAVPMSSSHMTSTSNSVAQLAPASGG